MATSTESSPDATPVEPHCDRFLATPGNSFVLPEHRIVYMSTTKVACTSLKWMVADLAGDTFGDELRSAGAEVTEVAAYRATTVESDAHLGLYRELLERRIHAVTFTSANTVRAFVEIYGAEQSPDLLSATVVAAVGPGAADAAARAGIRVDVQAEGTTIAALVDGLVRYFKPFLQ